MDTTLPKADLDAVTRTVQNAIDALSAGDIESWLTWWTEDAVIMPPGMPKVVGHAAFREYLQHIPERRTSISNVRIEGRDDLAVLTAEMTVERPEGGEDAAKQMATLRRQPDGRWLITALAFNFDAPAAL